MGKNTNANEMAKTACEELIEAVQVGACVDSYMQDQVSIFQIFL